MSLSSIVTQFDPLMKQLVGGQDIHRAAIWGQIKQESNADPAAVEKAGTNEGGIGLIQWTGPRRRLLEAYAQQRNKPWQDLETQVRFMCVELHGPESHRWEQIQKTTTLEAATETAMLQYERPAISTANLPRRIQGAKEALAAIQAAKTQEKKMTDVSGVGEVAVTASPSHTLAKWIQDHEVPAEVLIKGFLISKGVPAPMLDTLFGYINRIDLSAIQDLLAKQPSPGEFAFGLGKIVLFGKKP
jgi:hypothetical protein